VSTDVPVGYTLPKARRFGHARKGAHPVLTLCALAIATLACAALPDSASDFSVTVEPALSRAASIAVRDIDACRSGPAFVPDSVGHYDGIWLTDSVFTADAYRYTGADCRDRLRAVVTKFAAAQEPDGNIPMAFWGKEGVPDFGGRYDLAQDRKQNRDMESAYTFTHACHMLWKCYADRSFVVQQLPAVRRALASLEVRRDAGTGLILATYGPPNSDVSIDHAVPRTTAHVYFNILYVAAYREASELEADLGANAEARRCRARSAELRGAINRHLWIKARGRYEPAILRTPVTTDAAMQACAVRSDTRFPVVDNMMALVYEIPDSATRAGRLMQSIAKSE
jgi:hypothetical protein